MTSLVEPESKLLSVNGLHLHYLDWGNTGAAPVVCVHGYTSSAQACNAPARHFQDRFHIIAPDVRGHGESAWSSAGAYQYSDLVSDLAALVDRLELARFYSDWHLDGGHNRDGLRWGTAGTAAALGHQRHRARRGGGTQRITQTLGSRPEEFATLEDAMAYRCQAWPVMARRSAEDQRELALGVLREQPDGRWVWKMDPAYIQQRVQHGPPQRPALWPVLQRVLCRTLVVWGTESDILSEAQAR